MDLGKKLMFTRISEINPQKRTVEVQVRAEDLKGTGDHGGVRIFDDEGHAKDFNLDFKDSMENPVGPRDDLWAKEIPIDELPRGINLQTLRCTGWVDVDADGATGTQREWEGRDWDIKAPKVDALSDIGPVQPPGSHSHYRTLSRDVQSGTLSMEEYSIGKMTGSHSMGYTHGIREIRLSNPNDFFGGAEQLQALLIPRVEYTDRRGSYLSPQLHSKRELRDLQKKNLVTLTKQADGSYLAKAPDDKAFATCRSDRAYSNYGDDRVSIGWEIALTDPATDKWDSMGFDQNYVCA